MMSKMGNFNASASNDDLQVHISSVFIYIISDYDGFLQLFKNFWFGKRKGIPPVKNLLHICIITYACFQKTHCNLE